MGQQRATTISASSSLRTVERLYPAGLADAGDRLLDQMPKLRELREDVFFRAESIYLHNLINLTGHNIRRACELSGLSRSRLYTLLKKYQIVQPLNDRNRHGVIPVRQE